MEGFYGFLFHHNDHTGLWAAFRREDQHEYMKCMHPHEGSKAIFANDIATLIDLINRGAFPKPNTETIYKLEH